MKYLLIIVFAIFLNSGLTAQLFITGATIVCEDQYTEYSIPVSGCGYRVEVLSWEVVGGEWVEISDHAIRVHWNNPEAGPGSVDVLYRCWPNINPMDAYEDWAFTKDVDIRYIQKPLFGAASMDIPMGENDPFIIFTPDQGTGFNYSWTFPECLPGFDGAHATYVNPDLYSSGTICLTVTNTYCGVSHSECIDIYRSCLNSITYSAPDELPIFTSVNQYIHTSGNIVTTLPDVEFKAGEAIHLNPGFYADAEFLAHIAPCGSPSGKGCIGLGTSGLASADDFNSKMETLSLKVDVSDLNSVPSLIKKRDNKMKVFPNPASDIATLSIPNFIGKYQVEIFNIQGQSLKVFEMSEPEVSFNIGDFNSGLYLIRASNGAEMYTHKLLKE